MNYNTKMFSRELVLASNLKINRLIQKQKHLLDFLKDFLMATNQVDQIENCYCFVELTIKIRLNLEVANDLLPKLNDDYRFKTSINLVYRSIIDDMINAFYLSGFVLKDDDRQVSLANELKILHKEFLNSSSKGIEADNEHLLFIYDALNKTPPKFEDFRQEIMNDNPELFENGELKNNKKLRQTSNPILQELLKDTGGAKFITEEKKLEFIAQRYSNIAPALKGLFKYLSQFQHYSPKMHEIVLSDAELDIETYNRCLFQILHLVDFFLNFIVLNDPEHFKRYFKELMAIIIDVNEAEDQ